MQPSGGHECQTIGATLKSAALVSNGINVIFYKCKKTF